MPMLGVHNRNQAEIYSGARFVPEKPGTKQSPPQIRLLRALGIKQGKIMGIEYSIQFNNSNPTEVEKIIGRLAHCPKKTTETAFEFRANTSSEGMPDATIMLTSGGLYFCDNGGRGREFLGRVVAALTSSFGVVTIQELE